MGGVRGEYLYIVVVEILSPKRTLVGGTLRTTLITSIEELADYTDRWEELRMRTGGTVYNNIILTSLWLETFKDSSSPRVILIENGGELIGAAPLANSKLNFKGLSLKVLSLVGGVPNYLRLVTNSIMSLPERSDVPEQMIREIKHLDWSFLWTENMDENDTVRRYIQEAHSTWHAVDQAPHMNITVPLRDSGDIIEDFDRHARDTIKKAMRRLERGGYSMDFHKVPSEKIDQAVDTYARQHIERWQSKGGSTFLEPKNVEFLKKASKISYGSGKSYAYECLIDGEVAGQIFGYVDGDKAFGYRIGMNNTFSRFSPGWLVSYNALTDLRNKGISHCVMGGGEQLFKYEMGGKESRLVGIEATRGVAAVISRVVRSNVMKRLDSRVGIMKKALGALSVERMEKEQDPFEGTL